MLGRYFLIFVVQMIEGGYGCGFAIVVLSVLFLDRFVIRHACLVLLVVWYCILLFERLKEFLFDCENIPKNPAKSMRATLACLFTCVCIAHVL